MAEAEQILRAARSIVLVDWPSRDVPETLARAGYTVSVKGGPGPDDYSVYEMRDGSVVSRPVGHAPEHVDLVYAHRPIAELPGIVALAQRMGATAVWRQSGLSAAGGKDPRGCWMPEAESDEGRTIVEAAGLTYVQAPYIAGEIRRLGIQK